MTASTYSVLFVPLSFEGCSSSSGTYSAPSYTQTTINTYMSWVQSMFSTCSYGKTRLTSSTVAPLTKLACSGKIYGSSWSAKTCTSADYVGWADTANLAILSGSDLDSNFYSTTTTSSTLSLTMWPALGPLRATWDVMVRLHAEAG